ncbi:Co-chaperone Hsc20 [Auricularia subglabra TFB-10046 SS5]|nr:Co-chaperone Hsc20 [Auricularia subglabra TFB-10046 SS5]
MLRRVHLLRLSAPSRAAPTTRRSLSSTSRTCPKCGAPLPTALPVCPACRHISPITPETTLHELLDQPTAGNPFRIDPKALRAAFLRAQQVCHPDAWGAQGSDAQALASAHSALVNKAYRTLENPRTRAEYILAQRGAGSEEHESLDDPELVMKVMEMRERLEDCESDEARAEVAAENREEMNSVIARIEQLIEAQDWENAKLETIKLKYLEGIDAAAKGIEHH